MSYQPPNNGTSNTIVDEELLRYFSGRAYEDMDEVVQDADNNAARNLREAHGVWIEEEDRGASLPQDMPRFSRRQDEDWEASEEDEEESDTSMSVANSDGDPTLQSMPFGEGLIRLDFLITTLQTASKKTVEAEREVEEAEKKLKKVYEFLAHLEKKHDKIQAKIRALKVDVDYVRKLKIQTDNRRQYLSASVDDRETNLDISREAEDVARDRLMAFAGADDGKGKGRALN